MAEPFLGEIKIMGFNFAPLHWAGCDGQVMSIAQNQSLYAVLGTQFGGNGVSTFALPDLRSRSPLGPSNGRIQGQSGGEETVTLAISQMPAHTHTVNVNSGAADQTAPTNHYIAAPASGAAAYKSGTPNTQLNAAMLMSVGGTQPHNNMQPTLVVNFCIALSGLFPSRN